MEGFDGRGLMEGLDGRGLMKGARWKGFDGTFEQTSDGVFDAELNIYRYLCMLKRPLLRSLLERDDVSRC